MNYLILNLAVADIMVALFIIPRFIFVYIFSHPDGMKDTVLCKLLTGGNLSHSNQGQLTATKVEVSGKGNCRLASPGQYSLKN